VNRIWIGTDDGVIQTTSDGGASWTDVTPPAVQSYWKIFMIDAGRFDARTAYAAVNTLRVSDMRSYIYRTHDAGRTWTEIVTGLDDAGPVNAVREDPQKRGLLYASTEKGVYVSFDDGAHWQSLRLNLPATSVRDLIVKDDDLAVATHGRGFWILDDISPLRAIDATTASRAAVLFAPGDAWRVQWNKYTDTPLPPWEPTGTNPPEGALLYYALNERPRGPVVLEIVDAAGRVARRFSSDDPVEPMLEGQQVPPRWVRPQERVSAQPGMHRFAWDLRYESPAGLRQSYPISAISGYTPAEPRGPLAMPGEYTVRLTVDGTTATHTLRLRMDPRYDTSSADLRTQFDLSMQIKDVLDRRDRSTDPEFTSIVSELERLYRILQDSDQPPTPVAVQLVRDRLTRAARFVQ
jgi:hypothetical protein